MPRFRFVRAAVSALLLGSILILPGLRVGQMASPSTAHASGGVDLPMLDGHWRNVDAQTISITKLNIYFSPAYNAVRLDVSARCHPTDCFWGTVTAVPFRFIQATATYHFSFANKYLAIWRSDSQLKVKTHVDFIDGSGRKSYDTLDVFVRTS